MVSGDGYFLWWTQVLLRKNGSPLHKRRMDLELPNWRLLSGHWVSDG